MEIWFQFPCTASNIIYFCFIPRFKAFCRGALQSIEDGARAVNPTDGSFQHEMARAYVLPQTSVSYSMLCNLCSTSSTPFRGLAFTVFDLCDVQTREGEVRLK